MHFLPYIRSIETLGDNNDSVAQSYMKCIAERIVLILPRRGWYIGVLKEFYPRKTSLLGLNMKRGAEICIRLRIPGDREAFLPFHEVVCTVLHELAHCQEDKHTKPFWNLYYELLHECEAIEVGMLLQGEILYPKNIASSIGGTIAKRVHTKSQSPVVSKKFKPEAVSLSALDKGKMKPCMDRSSEGQPFLGIGRRLGGLSSATAGKPNAAFLSVVAEGRLRIQDRLFSTSESRVTICGLETSLRETAISTDSKQNSEFKSCQCSTTNTERDLRKNTNLYDICEGQENQMLKRPKQEQSGESILSSTTNIHSSSIGLRASCPITID